MLLFVLGVVVSCIFVGGFVGGGGFSLEGGLFLLLFFVVF